MPPNKGKGRATSARTNSDHEELVTEIEDRPRRTLRYKNVSLSKAKNADLIRTPVGACQMPQDPIYSRLLTESDAGFPNTNASSTNQILSTSTTLLGSL